MRRKLLATCAFITGMCFQTSCTVTGSSTSSGLFGSYPYSYAGGSVTPNVPNFGTPLLQTSPPSAFGGGRVGGSAGAFNFAFGSP